MNITDTQTLKTRSGKTFVLRMALTAREVRNIRNAPLRHIKMGMETQPTPSGKLEQKPTMREYDAAAATTEADDLLITVSVIAYDDGSENILGRLLDGTDADFQDVLAKAKELVEVPSETK